MSSLDLDLRPVLPRRGRTSPWTSVMNAYARLLNIQARLQFPFERSLYEQPAWNRACGVVDFGCGDGSYLRILAREFPQKRYFGIESNPEMLEIARDKRRAFEANVSFHASLQDIGTRHADFILMRYVVMHLADRAAVFEVLSRIAAPGASLLVIEPDDEMYEIHPPLPLLDEALRSIKSVSRDRNLKATLDLEVRPFGFSIAGTGGCEISNDSGCGERAILEYLWALIELGLQRPLSDSEFGSLLAWASNNSRHVRFGFYSRLYASTREARPVETPCGP